MSENLFFNRDFKQDFTWNECFPLGLGTVLPENKKQISQGLKDMSSASIRNRFLGSKREFSNKELHDLTALDGWNHYALGIVEQDPHQRGVALIRLVRASPKASEAEVALAIIDDYQKKGLGTFLMNLIKLATLERDISTLLFTFLPQNRGILKLIQKVGQPLLGAHSRDYVQMSLKLDEKNIPAIKSELVKILPAIDSFELKKRKSFFNRTKS